MTGVLNGFATIAVVIAVGALLAHLKVLDEAAQKVLSRLAFFVASPALMVITLGQADVHEVLSRNLVATSVGVVVVAGIYVVLARLVWRRRLGDTVIGALTASYVNAGNLGIPVASYVLGDVAYVAPTLLLQLLVLQPLALAVLDANERGRVSIGRTLLGPLRSPLTIGSLIGLVIALTGWEIPVAIADPLTLIGGMAVPAMLIAYGIALRLGPGLGRAGSPSELVTVVVLKSVVQPLVAWGVGGWVLGVEGHALLAIVVCSALPTAQNIFTHAVRYDRAVMLARDAILLTTIAAVPIIAGISLTLG